MSLSVTGPPTQLCLAISSGSRLPRRNDDRGKRYPPHWRGLVDLLNQIAPDGLNLRWQEGRRLIHENGGTYNV